MIDTRISSGNIMSEGCTNTRASGSGSGAGSIPADARTRRLLHLPATAQDRIIKDGWGSRTDIQGFLVLKMGFDDVKKGTLILEGHPEYERVGGGLNRRSGLQMGNRYATHTLAT